MQQVLILGAGKIGALISGFLAECRDYEVHVADVNGNAANAVCQAHALPNLHALELDASDAAALEAHLRIHPADAIISSLPFYCNVKVAEVARKMNAHYFDLTGRFTVSDNLIVTLTVQNLLDKKPPIVGNTIGSTTYNSGNTFPSSYDALGRRYAVSAKLKF